MDNEDTAKASELVIAEPSIEQRQHMKLDNLAAISSELGITLSPPADVEGVVCEDMRVEDCTEEHIETTRNMLKLLASINGLGLAAPQIGIKKKFFVYWDTRQNRPVVCYNPKYYGQRPVATWGEKCLSYGDLLFAIKRFKAIQAVWYEYDPDRAELIKRTKALRGLEAEVFQHECDHLSGETLATKGTLVH